MSATSEYEPTARQDYGPATSSENVYEHILEHKLTDNMNVPSVRTPVLRAVPLSPAEGDPEPDSTNPESIIQAVQSKLDKEVEYHIAEKRCDAEMSVDTLSGIVRIEEANLDNVGHIAYPIIQETDDSNDGTYVENSATLIQAPLNTAIVQNVTKLPQNFTINVDAAVGNITAIPNVSQDVSGSQTLWLPTTILATSAPTDSKSEEDQPQSGVSQIIITSESYMNDTNQAGRRGNIVTETSYVNRPKTSKVQILSNISLPKNPTYSPQYITQSKEITPVYGTQPHFYKWSTNVVSQKQLNNSVLCTKPSKNQLSQSLIGCTTLAPNVINNSPIKNVSYSHTFTKSTNLNKTLNKVNNGANLNAMVAASSGNTQCHILSRVVSGPNKMSVHSGRKVNAMKGTKNSSQVSGQKNQSRAIKIIQQTGTTQKSESKACSTSNVTYKNQLSQPPGYSGTDTSNSKIIQKVGSPTHKPSIQQQQLSVQKFPSKGEHLVLQSPCGPVLISTAPISTSLPKGPHYVQSGSTPNLRYVQTYSATDNQMSTVSQVSANQQLTAQILQSLAQPKLMLQHTTNPVVTSVLTSPTIKMEDIISAKPINQKRIVFGDKSTLLTADDIIGMEERPNLLEELRRYSFQALAFVMLDHTYALPAQKQPVTTTPSTTVPTAPPAIVSPTHTQITSPASPIKRSSPVIISTAPYESPVTVPTSAIGPSVPVTTLSTIPMGALTYKQQPLPAQDDDTASVISSLDGDRTQAPRGGSDTETAPEGEEEGKTRCICDFTHDDGYMICCDRCGEWQHVDCMGIDRQNIPDTYMCELCLPRTIDRRHARSIQLRKREELNALGASDSDSSETSRLPGQRRKRLLTVTTYTNTSGSFVTTYNSNVPVLPPLPQPSLTIPKRGLKRPKKTEVVRKGTKRKLSEKRVKRKKEMMMNRNKYNANLSNQSHWQDSYELAMTNHYSPELRAKIVKYSSKLGNTPNMASAITAHLCTTVPHAGGKILISTKELKENTPIIELRGKYMLSNQHRPQLQNTARAGSQKPGPFVFFYRLPKDNTQICIDTRTYGNEARFVRRSCKPNAELQHCIVKGALHVYLVTIGVIQSNTEITVGHDTDGSKQPCACGNPKHCKVNGLNSLVSRKSIDYSPREKRSRNRCFSSSSPMSPPPEPQPTTPVKELPPSLPIKLEKKSPIKQECSPMSPIQDNIIPYNYDRPVLPEIKSEIDLLSKEELKPEIDEPDFTPVPEEKPKEEPVKPEPEPEPIIEETKPKIEAEEIVPENETLFSDEEKPEKVEEKTITKEEEPKEEVKEVKQEIKLEDERPVTRELTAKSACHDRSSRSSRTTCVNQDSLDDKTDDSQDKIQIVKKEKEKRKMTREERKMEAIMKAFERMEKAEQRKQEVKERQKRRESDPHPNATEKDEDDEVHNSTKKRRKRKGRARTTSQGRRRLSSADSDLVTSGDEPATPPRRHSAAHAPCRHTDTAPDPPEPPDAGDARDAPAEDLGLSSACLLVEAAVGSVESTFKLPKTKKTIATEWIGRSPERTPSPYRSPYRPSLVGATSLESLVQVASTMIGDLSGAQDIDHEEDNAHSSPPRTPGRDRNKPPKKARRITRNTPPAEVTEVVPTIVPQHSAKKRWLRQAISEESDSPSADVFVSESPPNEMITPLKKRRLARESLSCEQNPIVPCIDEISPVLTSEDSPVKEDPLMVSRQYKVRNIMDSIYGRDRTRSDSGQGSDDQCNMDNDVLNVNIVPHDSENIRRIIGVPPSTEEYHTLPQITKPEDIKTNNNNVDIEDTNYNKVVPMEIDTTVTAQPKLESNENSNSEIKGIDSPNDKINSCQSADTSGNSSPQRDEMDDIQKKIHSFHTENILILKSRNKKPKEKRKKVNLNFDLNMVDDQISIQLRTENDTNSSKSPEINGDIHDDMSNSVHDDKMHVSPENIPLPPVESIPLPSPENIPLPEEPSPMPLIPPPEAIPLPEEPMKPIKPIRALSPVDKQEEKHFSGIERPSVLENSTLPFSSRFSSTGLFSGIFSNMYQSYNHDSPINENVPSIIKSAIDKTASLDSSIVEKDSLVDELKNVHEILNRVNSMDSNNSVILSGVLKSSNKSSLLSSPSPKPTSKTSYCPRSNDPRLNPPPVEKPKPVRRKLSINEYRKRYKGPAGGAEGAEDACGGGGEGAEAEPEAEHGPEWSSESSGAASLSPQRLDAAAAQAADELEQRLHRELTSSQILKDGAAAKRCDR
ncbi:SET domain-containing protein upSET isoform 2-T2 [Aphomia sociella]